MTATNARGHLSSETIDLLLLSALASNEANEAKAHFNRNGIDTQEGFNALLGCGCGDCRLWLCGCKFMLLFEHFFGGEDRESAQGQERDLGQAWHHGKQDKYATSQANRFRNCKDLPADFRVQLAFAGAAGHDEGTGEGDHQRRYYRDKAVTDRQDRVGLKGLPDIHAVLEDPNQESGNDVD